MKLQHRRDAFLPLHASIYTSSSSVCVYANPASTPIPPRMRRALRALPAPSLPRHSRSLRHRVPAKALFRRRSIHPLGHRSYAMSSSPIEAAKRAAAERAVSEHFSPSATHIGIGSGSTMVYVVEAIKTATAASPAAASAADKAFVPTGTQSRDLVERAGLTAVPLNALPEDVLLDVAFDGADEVDDDLNCIKGGGACLFQEKLVVERARKFVCVAGTAPT